MRLTSVFSISRNNINFMVIENSPIGLSEIEVLLLLSLMK